MATPRQVLIVADASSAGMAERARGLGEGLAAHGCRVAYAQPREAPPDGLSAALSAAPPDVVVCVGWEVLAAAGRWPCPTALDLPAPLLADESPRPALRRRAEAKRAALALADYFTCASPEQRPYFQSWLILAGVPDAAARLAVVPWASPPRSPSPGARRQERGMGGEEAEAVAPLAAYVQAAERRPANAPPAQRIKSWPELLAEVDYHYRHGGVPAVARNLAGFAGKLARRLVRR